MSKILITREKNVLNVKLNRPEVHNALDSEMLMELKAAFDEPKTDFSLRALVLTSEGENFCAGADLDYMRSQVQFSLKENQLEAQKLYSVFAAGYECPLPVLAYIKGKVMGGAIGLVAIADCAVAEMNAEFCFSEVKLGLVPAVISPFVEQKMNSSTFRDYMLSGQTFLAQQARESHLVQFVGSESECRKELDLRIKHYLMAGPEAVRTAKSLWIKLHQQPLTEEIKNFTTQMIAERRVSKEGQEGMNAFFERRFPFWREEK